MRKWKRMRKAKTANEDPNAPDLDPESLDFGFDREDFEGLRRAIWSSEKEDGELSMDGEKRAPNEAEEAIDDEDIQKMERLMAKLQAVRDSNAGLPEDQRKRAAAKAVAEVMKEI
ncbi:hypothetical protein RRF57_012494 [Xylaria bambusicola]|uniref:Uncharacterized protein n=1 Tax=Xylaria bambusicola TaxID=326684 RepID=A0AAN7ZAZ1_9PEZI